jgi:hypothetical protein
VRKRTIEEKKNDNKNDNKNETEEEQEEQEQEAQQEGKDPASVSGREERGETEASLGSCRPSVSTIGRQPKCIGGLETARAPSELAPCRRAQNA